MTGSAGRLHEEQPTAAPQKESTNNRATAPEAGLIINSWQVLTSASGGGDAGPMLTHKTAFQFHEFVKKWKGQRTRFEAWNPCLGLRFTQIAVRVREQ